VILPSYTVKLGNKERFDKEQIGIKEPFPVTNLLHKDKELLALRNNFRATKKFFIAKFDYISLFSCFLQPISKFDQQTTFYNFCPIHLKKKIIIQNLIIVKNAFLRLKSLTDWKELYCMIFFI